MTLPDFHPVNVYTVQSGPNLTASVRLFVLGETTVNIVHMADWAECMTGPRGDAAAAERKGLCVNSRFLATFHIKMSRSVHSNSTAISKNTADTLCLHRPKSNILRGMNYSLLKLILCAEWSKLPYDSNWKVINFILFHSNPDLLQTSISFKPADTKWSKCCPKWSKWSKVFLPALRRKLHWSKI